MTADARQLIGWILFGDHGPDGREDEYDVEEAMALLNDMRRGAQAVVLQWDDQGGCTVTAVEASRTDSVGYSYDGTFRVTTAWLTSAEADPGPTLTELRPAGEVQP